MRINELMKVVCNDTKISLITAEGDVLCDLTTKGSFNEKYNELVVDNIDVEDNVLCISTEIPTYKVTGRYEVEIEVLVPALDEDDAYDKLGCMDIDDIRRSYDIEVWSEEQCDIEWEEAELY